MTVKCLGSGNAFGAGGRMNAAYFIRTSTSGILLDCGATTLPVLKKEHFTIEDVDVIVISHLHGDHFGGLPFILCEIISMKNRSKVLTIVGPEGIKSRCVQALECFYPGVEIREEDPITFMAYEAGKEFALGDLRLFAYEGIHSPCTNPHTLRLHIGGKVLAYSGDTEWTDDLVTASQGADLFICEASAYREPTKHHLSIETIIGRWNSITAKNIVLTHFGDESLKHLDEIPFTIAEDGALLFDEV